MHQRAWTDTTGGPQNALLGGFGSRRFSVARDGVTIAGGGLPRLCGLPQCCARRRDDAKGGQLPEGVRKGARPTSPFGPKGGGLPNRHLRTGAWSWLTAEGLVGVGRHGRCRNRDLIVAGLCRCVGWSGFGRGATSLRTAGEAGTPAEPQRPTHVAAGAHRLPSHRGPLTPPPQEKKQTTKMFHRGVS